MQVRDSGAGHITMCKTWNLISGLSVYQCFPTWVLRTLSGRSLLLLEACPLRWIVLSRVSVSEALDAESTTFPGCDSNEVCRLSNVLREQDATPDTALKKQSTAK